MKTALTVQADGANSAIARVYKSRSCGALSIRMLQALAAAVIAMLVFAAPCAALTKLYESFENNSSPPAGWNTEVVSGTNTLTFVTATEHPSGYSAYNKGFMVKFDSFTTGSSGVMRLKMTTPVASGPSPTVEFAWLESSAYTSGHDKVEVEWCTDGVSWSSAGTFERLNATEGWKIKTCVLPSGAASQSTLYLAFKFTANNGNDCYLDHVHLAASDSSAGDWTTMSSFTNKSLNGIWGSSAADVFAVGYDGAIVHFNGSAWNSMTDYYKYIFSSVWGSSATNVYAPGNIFADSWKTIMNYNGASWSGVGLPDEFIYGIWGSSASDVFAVGNNGRILHYNGSTWSTQTSSTTDALYGVWGSSATDVFAVGGIISSGLVLHYNGTSWSSMSMPSAGGLRSVWGASGSDVFAVGAYAAIVHYNGTSWSTMTAPSGTSDLFGVWGRNGSDVYAVGSGGIILHYDGSTWSFVPCPTAQSLHGIWGNSGSDVFIAGAAGVVLHGTPSTSTSSSTTTTIAPTTTTTTADSTTTTTTAASSTTTTAGGGATTTTTIGSGTTTTTTGGGSTTTTAGPACPFRRSSAGESGVQPLRQLRDARLDTAIGAVIASMYYQNMDEIADILQDSRVLRSRFNRLTRGNMPVVHKLLRQGSATIATHDLLEMHEFLTDMQGQAGLKLRMDIDFILRGLESGWLLQWMGVAVE